MEETQLLLAVILIPLGVLGLLLAWPLYLVKITKWENDPNHWSRIVEDYYYGLGRHYANYLIFLPVMSVLFVLGLVHSAKHGNDIVLLAGLSFVFVFQTLYTYKNVFRVAKNNYENSLYIFSLISLFVLLNIIGIIGFYTASFYGGVLAFYWGKILFKYKALNEKA